MSETGIFVAANGSISATELARGPWDPNAQHGGAPAALMMRAFERLPAAEGLVLARITYEFLRPAPLGQLDVEAVVARPGRRVQLLEGSISANGTEVVRARALQVRSVDIGSASALGAGPEPPPPGPREGRPNEFVPTFRPMFAPDAIEIRFVAGTFGGGPSTAWFRLRAPVVAGEEPTPLQRLAAAGDFGNGISSVLPWGEYLFINPDLTLYIERPPVGEWICLNAQTSIALDGIGTAEAVLYDTRGRVGRATQALLIAPL
ncbi:MAG TPA: thioesterase family protein [Solirubrobacteraceae bacterium]|nr:thioesterase family protein [Solirubrobacteraceae bacterium]